MHKQDVTADILEIQALKARYVRAADMKDWAALRTCLADDFRCIVKGAPRASANAADTYEVTSADEFVLNAQGMTSQIEAIHQLSLPEITLTGEGTASGIWVLHDYLIAPHCIFRGWGHYHDAYVRIGGRWKIQSSLVTRMRVEETWL